MFIFIQAQKLNVAFTDRKPCICRGLCSWNLAFQMGIRRYHPNLLELTLSSYLFDSLPLIGFQRNLSFLAFFPFLPFHIMKSWHSEINVLKELPALLRFLPSTLHYMSITKKLLREVFRRTHRNAVTRLQNQALWRSSIYLADSCTQRWSHLFDDKFLHSYRVMGNMAHICSHSDALYSLACTGIGMNQANWHRSHRVDKDLVWHIHSHLSHTSGQCSQTDRYRRTYFRIQYMYFHWHKAEMYRHQSTGSPFL